MIIIDHVIQQLTECHSNISSLEHKLTITQQELVELAESKNQEITLLQQQVSRGWNVCACNVTYQMNVLKSELTSQTDMLNVRILLLCLVTTGHYRNDIKLLSVTTVIIMCLVTTGHYCSYYRSLL